MGEKIADTSQVILSKDMMNNCTSVEKQISFKLQKLRSWLDKRVQKEMGLGQMEETYVGVNISDSEATLPTATHPGILPEHLDKPSVISIQDSRSI